MGIQLPNLLGGDYAIEVAGLKRMIVVIPRIVIRSD